MHCCLTGTTALIHYPYCCLTGTATLIHCTHCCFGRYSCTNTLYTLLFDRYSCTDTLYTLLLDRYSCTDTYAFTWHNEIWSSISLNVVSVYSSKWEWADMPSFQMGGFRKEKTNCHRFFHTKPLFSLCLCLCFCLTSPLSHAFFIPLTHDTSSWFTNKCKLRQHHLCIAMYASYFIPCHVQSISIDFAVIKNKVVLYFTCLYIVYRV